MTTPDFWKLIAGLGLFLYGMFHLEDTMKQLEGRAFKLFLQKHTKNKLSAIFSGTFVTAILQSSSIVNLMVLSFVGAGMLSMRNALGVALGANVGGTFNSWLIALLGFKINLAEFTLPIIGISGIGLIVFKNRKTIYQLSKFLMGFGLLFLGLAFMKESMDSIIKDFDFTPYLQYNRIVFVLIGFVITALIQTSAATVVIVLTALYSKIIPIETAVAVVLGAELGTTIKLLIGSIGGIAAKKRVAFGNILFNVATSLIGYLFLVPIIHLLNDTIGVHDPIIILVAFQTTINIAGVFIFYFFLDYFGDFLEHRFKNKVKTATYYLPNASPEIADTAVEMIEKEVGLFVYSAIQLNLEVFQIQLEKDNHSEFEINYKTKQQEAGSLNYSARYKYLKQAEGEIVAFYSKMAEVEIKKENLVHINQLMAAVRNAMYSSKGMKDILADKKEFSNSINDLKFDTYKLFQLQLSDFYKELSHVFTLTSKEEQFEILVKLLEKIKREYEERMNSSNKDAGTGNLKEVDISTLFNINRELYSSCKAIIFSAKDYLLDTENADKFENISLPIL